MKYILPTLNYSYSALGPHIDEATMTIHHTKHHQAYIDKLNAALEKHPEIAETSLEELLKNLESAPEDIRPALKNHGGGHLNHSLFWEILAPESEAQKTPGGELAEMINKSFGGFDVFKEQFASTSANHFGSGWAWLVLKYDKTLGAYSLPNQDSPFLKNDTPIMGLDVWEHAYYLKYQNKRADYITAFWNVLDWEKVEQNYKKALG